MTETRTIQVFTFEELSDDAPRGTMFGTSPKARARDTIGQWLSEDANEDLQEFTFEPALEEWGFPTTTVEWSLGYSQGDGVAFYGSMDEDDLRVYLKRAKRTRYFRALLAENVDISVTIERNSFGHHYSHWNTMSVAVEYYGDVTPLRDSLRDELNEEIQEIVKTVSRELERAGYAALEVEDEQIVDHCEANEIRFLASGEVAPS